MIPTLKAENYYFHLIQNSNSWMVAFMINGPFNRLFISCSSNINAVITVALKSFRKWD